MITAMFGSGGTTSTPSNDKRNLSDTSIADTSLSELSQAKQPRMDVGGDSDAGVISILTEIRSCIDKFESNFENQIKNVLDKIDSVCLRL